MKRLSIVLNIIFMLSLLGWLGFNYVARTINLDSCHIQSTRIGIIARALDAYHADSGGYPIGMDDMALRKSLEPKYLTLVGTEGILYYSDGVHYELHYQVHADGEIQECRVCELRIRDGVWVSWPNGVWLPRLRKDKAS